MEEQTQAFQALRDDILREKADKHRRSVILTGGVALLVLWLDLTPRSISALDIRFDVDDRAGLRIALLVVLVHFLASFVVYALSDIAAWLEMRGTALAFRQKLSESHQELFDEWQTLGGDIRHPEVLVVDQMEEEFGKLAGQIARSGFWLRVSQIIASLGWWRFVVEVAPPLLVGSIATVFLLRDIV
jgi:hypothetical protein